ncbi:MAG: hypothetical protein WBM86_20705, partial [Waterburya sp.]
RIQIHSFNCGSGVGHLRHYKMLESCTPSTEFRSRCSRWEKPASIALRRCREYVTNKLFCSRWRGLFLK